MSVPPQERLNTIAVDTAVYIQGPMADESDKEAGGVPLISIDEGDWAELETILGDSGPASMTAPSAANSAAVSPGAPEAPARFSVDDLLERTLDEATTALAVKNGAGRKTVEAPVLQSVAEPVVQEAKEPASASTSQTANYGRRRGMGSPGQPKGMRKVAARAQETARRQSESQAVAELRDKVRQFADETASYKKRMQQEANQARTHGREDVLQILIASVDMLQLATTAAGEKEQLLLGLDMVLKQLFLDLDKIGLKTIDPLGESFDPHKHEAVVRQIQTGVAPGTIIGVRQRGYSLDGHLIRPAKVVVAAGADVPVVDTNSAGGTSEETPAADASTASGPNTRGTPVSASP